MLTTRQLADEMAVEISTVRKAVYAIWGEETEMADIEVPASLVPSVTKGLVLQAADSLVDAPVQDLRVVSYVNRSRKKITDGSIARIPMPTKQVVRDEHATYTSYVFTEDQANLIRALIVPDRVEAVKAMAVMNAQLRVYESTIKTLLLAYDKTAERVIDTRKAQEIAKSINVAYERALDEKRKMHSQLQALLNSWADKLES